MTKRSPVAEPSPLAAAGYAARMADYADRTRALYGVPDDIPPHQEEAA